jgi:hypothetical protein
MITDDERDATQDDDPRSDHDQDADELATMRWLDDGGRYE